MTPELFKVIAVSNFDDESVSHRLIIDGLPRLAADFVCDSYNARCHDYSTYYHRVVPQDYKLYVFDPT